MRGLPAYVVSLSTERQADLWLYVSPSGAVGAGLRVSADAREPLRIPAQPAAHTVQRDRWVHVVMTCDGAAVRLFVDGRLDKTVALPAPPSAAGAPLQIGRCGLGKWTHGFTGRVDDVMLWSRTLTEVEVLGLWAHLKRSADDPTQFGPRGSAPARPE